MKYLPGFLWKQANAFVKIFTPPPWYGCPRGIFVTIARDFQITLKLELSTLTLDFVWVDFYTEI